MSRGDRITPMATATKLPRILRLPVELRLQIYQHLFGVGSVNQTCWTFQSSAQLALLRVCKTIYSDALPFLCKWNALPSRLQTCPRKNKEEFCTPDIHCPCWIDALMGFRASTRSFLRHIQIIILKDGSQDENVPAICEFEQFCQRALPHCENLESVTLRFDADDATLFGWANYFATWPVNMLLERRNIRMLIREEYSSRDRLETLLYYACHDLLIREPKIFASKLWSENRQRCVPPPRRMPIRWIVPETTLGACRKELEDLELDDAFTMQRFRASFLSGLQCDEYEDSYPRLKNLPQVQMALMQEEMNENGSRTSALWEMQLADHGASR